MKNKAKNVKQEAHTMARNLVDLLISTSLLICAFYNAYNALNLGIGAFELKVRVGASAVIALMGAYQLVQYLRNREVK